MRNKLKILGLLVLISFVFNSCFMGSEQFKYIALNDRYQITYMKNYHDEKITSFDLLIDTLFPIRSGLLELIYNYDYIYAKSTSSRQDYYFFRVKSDKEEEEETITENDYLQFKSECVGCRFIDVKIINEKDKDIPEFQCYGEEIPKLIDFIK